MSRKGTKPKNGTSVHIDVLDQPGHLPGLIRFIVVCSLNSLDVFLMRTEKTDETVFFSKTTFFLNRFAS